MIPGLHNLFSVYTAGRRASSDRIRPGAFEPADHSADEMDQRTFKIGDAIWNLTMKW